MTGTRDETSVVAVGGRCHVPSQSRRACSLRKAGRVWLGGAAGKVGGRSERRLAGVRSVGILRRGRVGLVLSSGRG
jgi:hypothetical protein